MSLPEGVHSAPTTCPSCGRSNPQHVHPSGRAPATGDCSVCWGCGTVLVFEVGPLGVATRLPTEAELAEAMASLDVRQALAARAESYTPNQALALRRPHWPQRGQPGGG